MRETWDDLWSKRQTLSVEEVIAYDSIYYLLKRLVKLSQSERLSILEVGCGSGIYTLSLLRESRDPSNTAVLIDYSAVALKFARENAESNRMQANLLLADAFKLPFPDNSFDIVWNGGVNEHFQGERRQLIFNEMARVCKPGGQMIVIVPNSLNMFYRLWKRVLTAQGRWQYGFELPFSVCELRGRMKKAGLMPVKISGRGTLTSPYLLLELIPRKDRNSSVGARSGSKLLAILRKTVLGTDKVLGSCGGLTGVDIGIAGIKSARM